MIRFQEFFTKEKESIIKKYPIMKKKKLFLPFVFPLLVLSAGLSACGDDNGDGNEELNIVERIETDNNYSTLSQLITDLELEEELSGGELTLFAPTNDAFNELPEGSLDGLTDEQLTEIITYHAKEGENSAANLEETQDFTTLQGERILVQISDDVVMVNGSATVVDPDLPASNGIIHGIDEVLLPAEYREPSLIEVAENAGNYSTLLELIENLGLTTTFQFTGPYTAFAPDDDAFNTLYETVNPDELSTEQQQTIINYHVIEGEISSEELEPEQTVETLAEEDLYITTGEDDVMINGSASVVAADLEASNGFIHAIDQVLLPNEFSNVAQIIEKNYDLTTLRDLLEQYDLVETISDDGPYTVFAPTNQAFEDANDVIATLSEDQIEEVLLYHVVPTEALSTDLQDGQTIETAQGEEITVSISDETVTLNGDVTVERADLDGSNGVVHIIDGVLVPPSFEEE